MKQAGATLDRTSGNPQQAGGLDADKGDRTLNVRPMARATAALEMGERARPRRLRPTDAPLPPVSRLVYRAGAVSIR